MNRLIPILLLFALLLTGCFATHSSSDYSTEGEIANSESNIQSISAELKVPGMLTAYIFLSGTELYEPFDIKISGPNPTFYDVINLLGEKLEMPLLVKEIKQKNEELEIYFEDDFIDKYSKGQIEVILNSLATTLKENYPLVKVIRISLWPVKESENIEEFVPRPLKLITPSTENYFALRSQVPYEGLSLYFLDDYIVQLDETGKKLADFISRIGYIEEDVNSPSEIPIDVAIKVLLNNTKFYYSTPDAENYREVLIPFEKSTSEKLGMQETMFWLKEHVEETAKLLFGDEYKVTHKGFSQYRYFEKEGVYTPPHSGGYITVIPVIFSYKDLGDSYNVELTYIFRRMEGYLDNERNWEPIPDKEIKDYAVGKADRREIVLKKTSDGGYNFISCKKIAK